MVKGLHINKNKAPAKKLTVRTMFYTDAEIEHAHPQVEPLTKGMYYYEHRQPPSTRFGLTRGQLHGRACRVAKNNGWYNKTGEKLGWGDLSALDFRQIMSELEEKELFILLGEQDSFWHFVTHNPGTHGRQCRAKPKEMAPGADYVAKHARYIISKDKLFVVMEGYDQDTWSDHGLSFKVLTRAQANELIKTAQSAD